MKMLPDAYQFWAFNNAGQDIIFDSGGRISLRIIPWKLVDGDRTPGTPINDDFGFSAGETIGDEDARVMGTAVDNSSTNNWGAHIEFQVTMDNIASAGSIDLFIEYADIAAAFPSESTTPAILDVEKQLIFLVSIPITSDAVDQTFAVNFEL